MRFLGGVEVIYQWRRIALVIFIGIRVGVGGRRRLEPGSQQLLHRLDVLVLVEEGD